MVLGIKLNEIQHFESFWKFVGQQSQLEAWPQTLLQLEELVCKTQLSRTRKKCHPQMQHLHFLYCTWMQSWPYQNETEWLYINPPSLARYMPTFSMCENRIKSLVLYIREKKLLKVLLEYSVFTSKISMNPCCGVPIQLLWIFPWGIVYSCSKLLGISQPQIQECIGKLNSRDSGVRGLHLNPCFPTIGLWVCITSSAKQW